MTVQPTLHTSEAEVAPESCMISGAIQYGVPTTCASLSGPASVLVETPKSASLTVPSLVVKMLAPLISLCITPWSWRYCRPWRTCVM